MDATQRREVWERAGHRCEYCRLRQIDEPGQRFHVEHVIARQHAGTDNADNLALACQLCNCLKGPNLSGIDPDTGTLTRLFHPRNDVWREHFHRDEAKLKGMTAVGRTTVWLLEMNCDERIALRTVLLELGDLD